MTPPFIYIPIWLDLLSSKPEITKPGELYLHSNMVRFIIYEGVFMARGWNLFTFQYG